MQKKGTSWMADWRDASGKRHRKAFPTRRAALGYQTKQQRKALLERHPRPTPRRAPSRKRGPAQRRSATRTTS